MLKPTYAAGIGYVDYDKVIHNFQYAKHTMREIDLKNAEIRKYLQEKETEFSKLESPLQKKKFEENVQEELKIKEQALADFRAKREEIIYNKIHAVCEKIRLSKGYDAILDIRSVFSGGENITEILIETLNNGNIR